MPLSFRSQKEVRGSSIELRVEQRSSGSSNGAFEIDPEESTRPAMRSHEIEANENTSTLLFTIARNTVNGSWLSLKRDLTTKYIRLTWRGPLDSEAI